MKLRWWRHDPLPPTDVDEALEQRRTATDALEQARDQASSVARLTDRLIARREQNHFGDSIQITFRPKGA